MVKFLAALVASFGLMFGAANASSISDIHSATGILLENGNSICTAELVKDDHARLKVVSAAHCWSEGKEYKLRLNEKDYDLTLSGLLKDSDTVSFSIPGIFADEVTPIDVASESEINSLEFGSEVITYGYPLSLGVDTPIIYDGRYSGLIKSPIPGKNETILAGITLAPGMSGGGLYAKFGNEYKLIGTNYASNGTISVFGNGIRRILGF